MKTNQAAPMYNALFLDLGGTLVRRKRKCSQAASEGNLPKVPYREIMDTIPRIIRIEADDPYSAGVRLGESLGRSFDAYLEDYIATRILAAKNFAKPLETHAVAWN